MANMADKIRDVIANETENISKYNRIVMYGCTIYSRNIHNELLRQNINLSAIVDNDLNKVGGKFLGVDVYKPSEYLQPCDLDTIIIVCSIHEKDMVQSLENMGYSKGNILCIPVEAEQLTTDSLAGLEANINLIKKGYDLYSEIVSKYSKDVKLIVAPKASGDIFIACFFIEEWCKKHQIKDYVLLGMGKNLLDVTELFNIKNIIVLSEEEKTSLASAYMYFGNKMHIKFLSEWELRIRNSYFPVGKSSGLFINKFKYETFDLEDYAEIRKPIFNAEVDISKYDLEKGKTVIIAPYAYSSPSAVIQSETLEKLVNRLKSCGFKVFTVGYGDREPAITNTKLIKFDYKDSLEILEYAGYFIGVRSGLCDITYSAKCKKIIIYGNGKYSKDFFSLKNNFEKYIGEEIVYNDYTEEEFINYTINCFIEGD